MSHFVDPADRYRADSLIATGGMGEVWRGWDTTLERPIAIKVLRKEYAGDTIFRARFEAEARHAAGLLNPGIAALWDVGQQMDPDGIPRPFLVMELVEGQPLSALIRRGQGMEPAVVADLIAQVGDGLAAAHRAGIVHRDVKPANLLVTPEGQVKITDFGIARALSAMALTGTGAVMGTPQYLSPEQARGESASPASDVYGLGVVAYECLTGKRPFDHETPVATALAHLNDPVPTLPDSVPPALAAVITRALTKKPADRYADGAVFAAAIRAAMGATGPSTAATAVIAPTAAGAGAAPASVVDDTPPTQALRSPLVAGAAGAATGVAGVAGAAGNATGRAPAAPPPDDDRSWPVVATVLTVLVVAAIAILGWLLLRGSGEPTVPSGPATSQSDLVTPSAPTSSVSRSPSAEPSTFSIPLDQVLGRDLDDVLADLRGLRLVPTSTRIVNPGNQEPNTVAGIDPSTGLSAGDAVTVTYYGPVGVSSTPTSTPTAATPTPTRSATPTPEPTPTTHSATPTPTPTAPSSTTTSEETTTPAARKETP